MKRFFYFTSNIFFIIHLVFGTRHFGVNNKIWSRDASLFYVPFFKGLISLPTRVRMMKKRAFMGFIPLSEAGKIFPEYYKKNYGKISDELQH